MIVVSHRGPYLFSIEGDGQIVANRGPGGLAGTLHALAVSTDALAGACCVSAALSDGDRAVLRGAEPPSLETDVVFVDLDPTVHQLHYEVVSNEILWFLFHGLFDLTRTPIFDESFSTAWDAYVAVNEAFADAVVAHAPAGDTVLVQDYPLALVPGRVRAARPDLRVSYFTHTPFCGPSAIRVLPDRVAEALCASLASVPVGFHTARWAREYVASVHEVLGLDLSGDSWFTAPLGPDPEAFAQQAATDAVVEAARELDAVAGDRMLVFRTDRIDPAKNIVRGFVAYDHLLAEHPEWHGRVVFVAMLTSSREGLEEYVTYQKEVETAAAGVNERWGNDEWQPVVMDTRDDFDASVGGFTRYDVLLVNSLKDGLNLVAKEGPLVNRRDGVLCLSPEAGAYAELHEAALAVHPFDVEQAARALHVALSMDDEERHARATRLQALARVHNPRTWLDALVSHAR
ncbi:MAG TPA: trehalose-6-phosphate synthase [Acidimicrobiia bacterium]|nr:trehalose-6-phosphate synthase [Acidimicrobiia bacterium]